MGKITFLRNITRTRISHNIPACAPAPLPALRRLWRRCRGGGRQRGAAPAAAAVDAAARAVNGGRQLKWKKKVLQIYLYFFYFPLIYPYPSLEQGREVGTKYPTRK